MITRFDGYVARVLALLKELKLDEQTVVIFSSDNGPHKEGGHDPQFFHSSGILRGIKRDMIVQLATAGLLGATSTIDDDKKQVVAGLAILAASSAYASGYGRGMEDQADRVGLRYAYEAGYDITKGPRLWNRFAKKYGEGNKVVNFFFADHSQSAARATKLEKEIAYNYPDGPKPDGPARQAHRATPPSSPTVAGAPVPLPGGTQALVAPAPLPPPPGPANAAAASGTKRTEIKLGMTVDDVRKALGEPQAEVVFGEKTRWTYPGLTVVFVKGKVTNVQF